MNRDFFACTLKQKPNLLRVMLDFNGLRTFSSPPDELAAFPNAKSAWEMEAVRRRFRSSCVPKPDFWDFAEESSRLALMDATTLARLALTFGVAVMAPQICRLLRREDVRTARECLGENLYVYALHRARFQVDPALFDALIPEQSPEQSPVDVQARTIGRRGLHTLAAHWPEPLQACLALTKPGSDCPEEEMAAPPIGTDHPKQLWAALKKVLLKEVAPSWTPCFD